MSYLLFSVYETVSIKMTWAILNHGFYHGLSHSVVSDSLQPHGLEPSMFPCPWGFLSQGRNTGVSCHASSQPRDRTQVSRIAGGFFPSGASREARPATGAPNLHTNQQVD